MTESVRLSVNLSSKSADAVKELMADKGIELTEAIRRAIAVWKFVEGEVAAGNRIAILERGGDIRGLTLIDTEEIAP